MPGKINPLLISPLLAREVFLFGQQSCIKIYEVRVIDLPRRVRKVFHFSQGVTDVNLDLSGLNNGNYILQVFDKVKRVNLRAELIK